MAQGLKLTRKLVLVLLIALGVAFAGFKMFGRTVNAAASGNGWTLDDQGVLTITDEVAFSGDEFAWKADGISGQVKKVVINAGIKRVPDYAFTSMKGIETADLGEAESLGSAAFRSCTSLTSVNMSQVKEINGNAFDGCTALTSVNMKSVEYIHTDCFLKCENLTDIEAENLTSIESRAFSGCKRLKAIDLSKMKKISSGTFSGCEKLLKVDLSNVTSIEDNAFCNCSLLYSVTSLANVTEIGDGAFYSCTSLIGKLDLSSAGKIGGSAFSNCGIEEITLGSDKDVIIGDTAFRACMHLTTVKSGKIVSLGSYAFFACAELTNIDLSHVKTIDESAFGYCSSLETVDLRSLESMGTDAFYNSEIKIITVSKTFKRDTNFPTEQITKRYFIGSIGQDPERQNDAIINDFYPNATLYYTEWDVGLYIDGKVEKLSVLKGEKFARPEDPAKDGFTFTGWYTDRACTNLYDFDKAVTDTLILYAGWADNIASPVFKGYTVTLGGQIGVNFYTMLPGDAKKTDYILFSVEGMSGVQKVTVADAETVTLYGAKYDVFSCHVPAKNMTSKITAELYIGGTKVAITDYSVRRYADQIIANPRMYINAWPLVRAMLNYGAYAQEYFNFKTDDLANAGIDNSGYSINNVSFSKPYDPSKSNLPDYLEFTGVSLTLESDTVLKLQFTKNVPIDLTYIFKLEENGTETILPYDVSGDQVTVRIKGISAHRLDEDFRIKIVINEDPNAENSNYFVTYSPMTYAYNIITREETAERNKALKNLMKAMYRYNEAAKDYKKN